MCDISLQIKGYSCWPKTVSKSHILYLGNTVSLSTKHDFIWFWSLTLKADILILLYILFSSSEKIKQSFIILSCELSAKQMIHLKHQDNAICCKFACFNPCPAEPGYTLFLQYSVDPDQLASSANWSGSALFVIQYVNMYQQIGSNNLIGWKLEMGMVS